jgi:DNA (cytosine-5)-methyltransferase 1
MGVDGHGIANDLPDKSHPIDHKPKLTLKMVAKIQGFPDPWEFKGGKTSSYRQIGNAFPPPVAKAVGLSIYQSLLKKKINIVSGQLSLFDHELI